MCPCIELLISARGSDVAQHDTGGAFFFFSVWTKLWFDIFVWVYQIKTILLIRRRACTNTRENAASHKSRIDIVKPTMMEWNKRLCGTRHSSSSCVAVARDVCREKRPVGRARGGDGDWWCFGFGRFFYSRVYLGATRL